MLTPQRLLHAFKRPGRERGATVVEYAILMAIVAVVAILSVVALGVDVSTTFTDADARWPAPASPASEPCCSSGGFSPPLTATTTSTTSTTTTTVPEG